MVTNQQLSLAYASRELRPKLAALLALDTHLASVAMGRGDPLLVQMKLAWWRSAIIDGPDTMAPEIAMIAGVFMPFERENIALLCDSWEQVIGQNVPFGSTANDFAHNRASAVFGTLALNESAELHAQITALGQGWAQADLALRLGVNRQVPLMLASPTLPPRRYGALAVLAGLALRDYSYIIRKNRHKNLIYKWISAFSIYYSCFN